MDTVTYPDPKVEAQLERDFVPLKIDLLGKHPDYKEAIRGQRVIWGPTLLFTDAKGRELRRYVGWLAPDDFRRELEFASAIADFNRGEFVPSAERFARIVETPSLIRAEALYWWGISAYLAGGRDMDALKQAWRACADEYPETRWGQHAAVIEDA